MLTPRNQSTLVGAALLALLFGASCAESADSPSASTRFDLLPALGSRQVSEATAHAGDPAERGLFDDHWYSPVHGEKAPYAWMRGTRAALDLLTGLDPSKKAWHLEPGAGHYGIFAGKSWRNNIRPLVLDFIDSNSRKPMKHEPPHHLKIVGDGEDLATDVPV